MSVLSATSVLTGQPTRAVFRTEVLTGLSQTPKRLPCKYFYDRRGSMLFDAICAQPEYYLTRTEQRIMEQNSHEMAAEIGADVALIEFGSGSSLKTKYLLRNLHRPSTYIPVDISRDHLMETAMRLRREFSDIEVQPVCADFTTDFELPAMPEGVRRVVYFPGSTIGNFEPTGAVRLLHRVAGLCGDGGGLIVGIDLVKDSEIIERAYNDAAGVTSEFNLNLLLRINRDLCADFDLDAFRHYAVYDSRLQRVDIRLMSLGEQRVRINGSAFSFSQGEFIHTEYSHKYTCDRFVRFASEAGLKLTRTWMDEKQHFAVLFLTCE
jgi:dimethylhistidine N-methyltransferase